MFAACEPNQMVIPRAGGTAICASCLIDSHLSDRYWQEQENRDESKGGKYGRKARKGWKGKGYVKGKGKDESSRNLMTPEHAEPAREPRGSQECERPVTTSVFQEVEAVVGPPMNQGRPIYGCFFARRGQCDFLADGRCSYAHVYFGPHKMLREGDYWQRMPGAHDEYPCAYHMKA